jgi:two-component system sensor histidine kinase VicK
LTTTAASSHTIRERTEVLHGKHNLVNTVLQFTSNAKSRIDACIDYSRPSLAIEIEQLKKAFLAAKNRGVKLRYVTEVTDDNVVYCKELLKMVNELRHLEGIKGNFYVSEIEYIAPATLHEKGKPASKIIYSNVKEIVEHQQQYVFDSSWSRAIPAERRIREIEEGIVYYETKVLENKDQIFNHMRSVLKKSSERSVCSSIGGMQLVHNKFLDEYKRIVDRNRGVGRAEGKGIRWMTSINKDSIDLVKLFLNAGVLIRHLKNLTPMNFAVDSRNFYATIDKMEGGTLMEQLLISNEPAYISHYNYVFEELWKNGVDATDRIRDIEQGVDLADIEVIPSSARAQGLYMDIVKSASQEILWIFPTISAFIRQDKIGAIQLATKAAKEKNVKVKILVPTNRLIEQKIQELKQYPYDYEMDFRNIEQMSETKATILVVDRKVSLVMELKDDTKSTFHGAIGLSTYSNSRAGVLSYVAIFENLWRQAELYQQVKESNEQLATANEQLAAANEQLKVHGRMQREFIDIAAHELRTPIQPILGLTQVISSRVKDREDAELLKVVSRNAERLQKLTEDILDVTRIESNLLALNKEQFNLNEVIANAINDIIANSVYFSGKKKENTRIFYEPNENENIVVEADIARISQVISNLLNNAVKFTSEEEGGTISVILEVKNKNDNYDEKVIVRIKDTGIGIAPEMIPRLFTKFATKSEKGTGLGLFISKSIIEAHDGRIWAENNADGKGSTFYFSLPLCK